MMNILMKIKEKTEKHVGLLKEKDAGGKEILVEIGLAVIAITLLLVFKNAIGTYMDTMMNSMTQAMSKLFI
ncbi:MAG: hypothetical protein ACI4DV_04020 [Lachnospiraceae bacterium]